MTFVCLTTDSVTSISLDA